MFHFLEIVPLIWLTGVTDWIQKQKRITRCYTNVWQQLFFYCGDFLFCNFEPVASSMKILVTVQLGNFQNAEGITMRAPVLYKSSSEFWSYDYSRTVIHALEIHRCYSGSYPMYLPSDFALVSITKRLELESGRLVL